MKNNTLAHSAQAQTAQGTLHLEAVAEGIFHVRLQKAGNSAAAALRRYGILQHPQQPPACNIRESDNEISMEMDSATLRVNPTTMQIALDNSAGKQVVRAVMNPQVGKDDGRIPARRDPTDARPTGDEAGFGASFNLTEDEKIYGLGDVARDRLDRRDFATPIWVKNVVSYTPIPFMMSSGGWGLLVNTTWKHRIDVGKTQKDQLQFGGKNGELDFYLFAGDSLAALLERYTLVSGRPALLPQHAYGLTFVCNTQADSRQMLEDGANFRDRKIPCDIIGLEPGWMSENYDYSTEKSWSDERFYIPSYLPKGPGNFLDATERMGFKISLWLCCDYDLSYEEERNAVVVEDGEGSCSDGKSKDDGRIPARRDPTDARPTGKEFYDDDFEQDEHFTAACRMDKITKPDEPWFEHLKKFVDQGASAFKLDGANQVLEHPDRKWANGMSDQQMHNLYPLIYDKQMAQGYENHTGQRAMVYSASGYTGLQQYVATWAGDTGGGTKPLVSLLNLGLSGHVNTSCDMEITSPAGIHFGFLQPWSQLCSWNYWRHPWFQGEKLSTLFKFYARLRYRLLPYIYSMAHSAYRTGLPIARAMPLCFPDDPKSDTLLQQYMFGDSLLVAAFTDQVHLPAGKWIDYWTHKTYEGAEDITYTPPKGRGGPLFIKAGAIIPKWPLVQYVGQKPIEKIALDIFPDGQSSFTLYEDDGLSLDYKKGAVATTKITCARREKAIEITIGKRQGEYDGMPEKREYVVRVYAQQPKEILIGGHSAADWKYDEKRQRLCVKAQEGSTVEAKY